MEIKRIEYRGWQDCYLLSNGYLELIVPIAFGPRILSCGSVGHVNLFAELPGNPLDDPNRWHSLGGHRLWVAPEEIDRTYYPDNEPVVMELVDDSIRLIAPVEDRTGLQKEIELRFSLDSAKVRVTHQVKNCGLWPIELAPWALSVMAPGGTAIIPLPKRGLHGPQNLLPDNVLVLWSYTDMSDRRWMWGRECIMLRQDPKITRPQKVGVASYLGWAAYINKGDLFVKTFTPQPGEIYPDFGSTIELFTNDKMLEVETLAPLINLEPGCSVSHTEEWHVISEVPEIDNEEDLITHGLPRIKSLLQ